ncbi:MAG: 3-hydroxyacyl-CoA dehydrogenase family protein [Acidobacteriota bacterium]
MNKQKQLVKETEPLLKQRKGGAVNLILASLMTEAGRMIDEGFKIADIEEAAQRAFGINKGFLRQMDEIGTAESINFLLHLEDKKDSEDDLHKVYDNFFSLPISFMEKLEEHKIAKDKSSAKWMNKHAVREKSDDLLLKDMLRNRFKAVSFMTAVELLESGISDIESLEKMCKEALNWEKGPFSMMNEMGTKEAMSIVIEKMEISHRREINFYIPLLLINQAQTNSPWRGEGLET